jgi:hypothetical protein
VRGERGGRRKIVAYTHEGFINKAMLRGEDFENSKLSEIKFRLLTNQKLERGEHKVQPTLEVRVFASFIVMLKVNVK